MKPRRAPAARRVTKPSAPSRAAMASDIGIAPRLSASGPGGDTHMITRETRIAGLPRCHRRGATRSAGASLCATRDGRSVDTTMSFTALDGLLMGTRPGTLDPGAVTYLMREHAMSAADIEDVLYHHSGLMGISGISSDMRTLLGSSDPHAREAVDLFVFRATREIGALVASLGGLDGLVFTAGIGEHAPEIRSRVCASPTSATTRPTSTGASGPTASQRLKTLWWSVRSTSSRHFDYLGVMMISTAASGPRTSLSPA